MPVRYSHPPEDGREGVYLQEHLEDVASRVRVIVPDSAETPYGESLQSVVETLAYLHDFGKATSYFQQYIGVEQGNPEFEQYRYHAPIGSFASYYALQSQGFEDETCIAGFVAVAKHHGKLPDVAEYVHDRTYRRKGVTRSKQNSAEKQQSAIVRQKNDINSHVPELAEEIFKHATAGEGSWTEFQDSFVELLSDISSTVSSSLNETVSSRENLTEACYGLVLECWGSLVLADKTSAAQGPTDDETKDSLYTPQKPPLKQLDKYIADLETKSNANAEGTRTEQLNYYRSQARATVVENAKQFAGKGGGVATLTLPTGMGKTLSGLSAALTVRDELDKSRIVYALPFTSIIDQVVDESTQIFETDVTSPLLTAHHHLSETTIEEVDAEKADLNDDVSGMLAESWRAGLTITTFVQLFESLTGPRNTQGMKLPALRDSVIILDEPQSLPLDWWALVPRVVEMLREQYNATVIAMTATQPRLFNQPTELVSDTEMYFDVAQRVEYTLDDSTEQYITTQSGPKTYKKAAAEILTTVSAQDSCLAICNTIDSAQRLSESILDKNNSMVDIGQIYAERLTEVGTVGGIKTTELASEIAERGEQSLMHLSTRHRPVDRLQLINTAKELTQAGHPIVTVSTQLVEAGVDISFDHVFRDLAPIDNIVQAAGRCNRSFERERGNVTIWWLDSPGEQNKTPAEAVYNHGPSLLPVAAQTLDDIRGNKKTIDEIDVAQEAVKEYYRRLDEEKNVGKAEYASYVDEARADELGKLSLIDQQQAVDVVICRTPEERNRIQEIKDAWDAYEFERVRTLMDSIRELSISIPVYRADSPEAEALGQLNTIHDETDLHWIDTQEFHFTEYFDESVGFVVPDSTVERRLL